MNKDRLEKEIERFQLQKLEEYKYSLFDDADVNSKRLGRHVFITEVLGVWDEQATDHGQETESATESDASNPRDAD